MNCGNLNFFISGLVFLFVLESCSDFKNSKKDKGFTISENEDVLTVDKPEPILVFSYRSSLSWVSDVIEKSNCVVNLKSFKNDVLMVERFDYTEDNGKKVYDKLINASCRARTYKTRNPWSRVNATTYNTNKKDFYFNLRNNPRSTTKMIKTAIHECLHLAGYSHGDNSSVGKQDSVNWKVAKIAASNAAYCF